MVERTHGMTGTRVYRVWIDMRRRCQDNTRPEYDRYGGRGISVCDRWNNSFEAFLEDMGEPEKGLTIERIDNDGDYEPGNCKWATVAEQNRNKRDKSQFEFRGKVKSLTEWAESLGIERSILSGRIQRYGWTVERAFTTPVVERSKRI